MRLHDAHLVALVLALASEPGLSLRDDHRARADLATRSLSVRASTADDKARTIAVDLATENPVRVYDMTLGPIDEVLRMDGCELVPQIPLLADHDRWTIEAIRGSLRDLAVDGTVLRATAHFADDPDSERAWQKVKARHLTDLSVGYRVIERTVVAAGTSATVSGRTYTAGSVPLVVATRWIPKEGSLVPIGADPDAKSRSTAPITHRSAENTPMTFPQWLKARGFDEAALTDIQKTALRASFDLETRGAAAAPAPAAAPEPATRAAVQFTTDQIRTMNGVATAMGVALDDFLDGAKYRSMDAVISAMNQARADKLGAQSQQPAAPNIRVAAAGEDKRRAAVEDALLSRMGAAEGTDQGMRREPLIDIIRHAALAAGNGDGQRMTADSATAYALRTGDFRGRAYTSSDFPNLLANISRKVVQKGFESNMSTWRQWCGRDRVTDFKSIKGTALVIGELQEQEAEGAPLKNANLTEVSYDRQAAMRGAHVVISEQTLKNDDLGEIGKTLRRWGAVADNTVELAVVRKLLGITWTGATTAAADLNGAAPETALAKSFTDFMNKLNPNSQMMGFAPRFLLVPANLMLQAMKQTVAVSGNPDLKVFSGKLTPIVIPHLASTAVHASASPDNFYLAGDHALIDTIIVSDMYDVPVVKETDTGAVPGMGLRVEYPFGVDNAGLYGLQKATKA